ncbi:MAG TPA: MFS transporter [Roseiflexaceae bacterium]|nr:MFS transporter [Roseiflexaceae bacterium]
MTNDRRPTRNDQRPGANDHQAVASTTDSVETSVRRSSLVVRRFTPNTTLALLSFAVFLGAVDLTIVTAVLPKIVLDLQVSIDTELNRAAWVITGYLLAYTVSMTFTGRLSDLYGRRQAYMVCLAVFTLGSAAVAAAPTLASVVAARVAQALGAGALVPIAMALAGDLFPPGRRAAALGIIAAVDTAGWMVGHLYGGALMRLFDNWRLLFWINVPLGVAALALTWLALRSLPIPRAAGSFDWRGALLVSGGLTALNMALSVGAELGQADFYGQRAGPPPYALPLALLALALLAAFVWAERRARYPLLDLGLFRRRGAAAACAINALAGFALALAIANVPLFINTRLALLNPTEPDILRRGAWESGLVLSALTLTMAATAPAGGWLAARTGHRPPALLGIALAAAGYGLLCLWQAGTGYPVMVGGLMVAGAGLGVTLAPAADAVIAAADATHRGAASALVIVLRLTGMTLGVSTLTLWGVRRQDALRRAAADNPQALSDPAGFLLDVAARVVAETFLFAVAALLLALALSLLLRGRGEY